MKWLNDLFQTFLNPSKSLKEGEIPHEVVINKAQRVMTGQDQSSKFVTQLKKQHNRDLLKIRKQARISMTHLQKLDIAVGIALSQGTHD